MKSTRNSLDLRSETLRFENVTVVTGNAVSLPVLQSDVIYVNAGVVTPPEHWIDALRPCVA
jgi:protein-L-isoaspartate(D-aspartate) O-methyltransferase